jgi:hypothetical protein
MMRDERCTGAIRMLIGANARGSRFVRVMRGDRVGGNERVRKTRRMIPMMTSLAVDTVDTRIFCPE